MKKPKFKIGDWVVVTDYKDGIDERNANEYPQLAYKKGSYFRIKDMLELPSIGAVLYWGAKERAIEEQYLELRKVTNSPLFKALNEEVTDK